jgi:transposase
MQEKKQAKRQRMTTRPYSQDLREKVIEYIKGGGSQRSASRVFRLGLTTIARWWKRWQAEGHCEARKRPGAAPRLNGEQVAKYVEEHPDFTANEMGEHFNMTAAGARYWLKKLGYSYKKKRVPMWKPVKRKERNMQRR